MGGHAPLCRIHGLIPLAPSMGNGNFGQVLGIFNQRKILIDDFLGIGFWQFLWIADMRGDNIELDNGFFTGFCRQPVRTLQAFLVDLNHGLDLGFHIRLGCR